MGKNVVTAGALVLQARFIYCWMNPLLVSIPQAHSDACYHQADCGAGNHVIISSHDIDLIYVKLAMPYTYYAVARSRRMARPGVRFRAYGSDKQVGPTPARCQTSYQLLGLPLCKTETEFFIEICAFREASRRRQLCCRGRHPTPAKCVLAAVYAAFLPGWFAYRRLNRKIWR